MTRLTIVMARADNGVIGRGGGPSWRLPADLVRFKALTLGKPMLMGRRTWDAIGRPLPAAQLVLTRGPGWAAEGAEAVGSLEAALAAVAGAPELMIVGGADLVALAEPLASRYELTEVHAEPDGDTRVPAPDPAHWREVARERHDGDPAYSFVTLERR